MGDLLFLVRWIRKSLGLPLLWAGQVLLWEKSPWSVRLLHAAWIVSGAGDWAQFAVMSVLRLQGPEAARTYAAEALTRRPSPEVAAWAGLLAVDAGDLDGAETALHRGRELGNDRDGLLDLLEFQNAARRGEQERMEVARAFLHRRDLPPLLSKQIQSGACQDLLMAGQLDQAAREAQRLLEIEPNGQAEMVLCAVAKARGDETRARQHLEAATDLSPLRRAYLEVLGNAAIGRFDQAREALRPLQQEEPDLARDLEQFLLKKEQAP